MCCVCLVFEAGRSLVELLNSAFFFASLLVSGPYCLSALTCVCRVTDLVNL